MHIRPLLALAAVAFLLASCGGNSAPELSQTASGTWLSPKIQGNKQQILTATTIQEGEGALDLTVMDMTMQFLPQGEILMRPDASGAQIVRLGIRAANIGTSDIAFSHNAFALMLKDGTEGRLSFYINADNASDFLQSQLLAPGESTEGALYFEMPESADYGDFLLEYRSQERTTALPLMP